MKLLQKYLNLRRYFTLTPMFKTKKWHFTPLSTLPLGGDWSEKLSVKSIYNFCRLFKQTTNKYVSILNLNYYSVSDMLVHHFGTKSHIFCFSSTLLTGNCTKINKKIARKEIKCEQNLLPF